MGVETDYSGAEVTRAGHVPDPPGSSQTERAVDWRGRTTEQVISVSFRMDGTGRDGGEQLPISPIVRATGEAACACFLGLWSAARRDSSCRFRRYSRRSRAGGIGRIIAVSFRVARGGSGAGRRNAGPMRVDGGRERDFHFRFLSHCTGWPDGRRDAGPTGKEDGDGVRQCRGAPASSVCGCGGARPGGSGGAWRPGGSIACRRDGRCPVISRHIRSFPVISRHEFQRPVTGAVVPVPCVTQAGRARLAALGSDGDVAYGE